jgi:hypothetical protein
MAYAYVDCIYAMGGARIFVVRGQKGGRSGQLDTGDNGKFDRSIPPVMGTISIVSLFK